MRIHAHDELYGGVSHTSDGLVLNAARGVCTSGVRGQSGASANARVPAQERVLGHPNQELSLIHI